MEDKRIKAIIFDLGNVLVNFDHWIATRRVSSFTDKSRDEIYNLFFDSQLTCLFEEGKISPQEFFLKIKEILNLKLDYDKFIPIWDEIFFLTKENLEVYNLVKQLGGRYKIALLSNINVLHFNYLKNKFPHLFEAFHHVIASYEIKVRKPHPLIYKKALELLGTSPGNVFYTDDRQELAESAKELGIRGFAFRGIVQLKIDLVNSGIQIN